MFIITVPAWFLQYEFPWGSHDVESIKNRGDHDMKRMVDLWDCNESLLKVRISCVLNEIVV